MSEVSHAGYLCANFHDGGPEPELHTGARAQAAVVASDAHHLHRSETPVIRALRQSTATDTIKWLASIAQILGYGATVMQATPLNLYFFTVGIIGWFIVGLRWNDHAIMLIHVVAVAAMIFGLMAG